MRSKKMTGYILTLAVRTMFDWLTDITELCHTAFATSASSNKTAFTFHFLVCLYEVNECLWDTPGVYLPLCVHACAPALAHGLHMRAFKMFSFCS